MALEIDFDAPLDRIGTHSLKWDARDAIFGTQDVLPLWVADLDFVVPEAVQRALYARLAHPVYGYTIAPESLFAALVDWFETRHEWTIDPARIVWSPGTVPAIVATLLALTEEGDDIIVPTPVYPLFFTAVERNKRRLKASPMLRENGRYVFDFEGMEAQAKAGAKLIILCNPHNPVGRVWDVEELDRLIDLALRYNLVVISDEVHADIVYPGKTHTMLARRAPAELRWVTLLSPAKTFNIPGLGLTAAVVSHASDQGAIQTYFDRMHASARHPLSMAAFEAAYDEGGPWLDALLGYLDGNRRWLHAQIQDIPLLSMDLPESTYLAWLDVSALEMNPAKVKRFFIRKAGLGLNPGRNFGKSGRAHMRLNFGTQRAVLEEAIERLRVACEAHAASR